MVTDRGRSQLCTAVVHTELERGGATVAVNKKFMFRSRTTTILRCADTVFFTVPIVYQKTVPRPVLRSVVFHRVKLITVEPWCSPSREAKDRVLPC